MDTKQQPEAMRLAALLDADEWPGSMTLVGYARECVAELLRQHARITELESQLAQRFGAADMATASAQGFRDGVVSVSTGSASMASYAARLLVAAALVTQAKSDEVLRFAEGLTAPPLASEAKEPK